MPFQHKWTYNQLFEDLLVVSKLPSNRKRTCYQAFGSESIPQYRLKPSTTPNESVGPDINPCLSIDESTTEVPSSADTSFATASTPPSSPSTQSSVEHDAPPSTSPPTGLFCSITPANYQLFLKQRDEIKELEAASNKAAEEKKAADEEHGQLVEKLKQDIERREREKRDAEQKEKTAVEDLENGIMAWRKEKADLIKASEDQTEQKLASQRLVFVEEVNERDAALEAAIEKREQVANDIHNNYVNDASETNKFLYTTAKAEVATLTSENEQKQKTIDQLQAIVQPFLAEYPKSADGILNGGPALLEWMKLKIAEGKKEVESFEKYADHCVALLRPFLKQALIAEPEDCDDENYLFSEVQRVMRESIRAELASGFYAVLRPFMDYIKVQNVNDEDPNFLFDRVQEVMGSEIMAETDKLNEELHEAAVRVQAQSKQLQSGLDYLLQQHVPVDEILGAEEIPLDHLFFILKTFPVDALVKHGFGNQIPDRVDEERDDTMASLLAALGVNTDGSTKTRGSPHEQVNTPTIGFSRRNRK